MAITDSGGIGGFSRQTTILSAPATGWKGFPKRPPAGIVRGG